MAAQFGRDFLIPKHPVKYVRPVSMVCHDFNVNFNENIV